MGNRFIGIGRNPDGPDVPLGFGSMLVQDQAALANYRSLTKDQQARVISYVQSSVTGEDAHNRIDEAVRCLRDNQLSSILL